MAHGGEDVFFVASSSSCEEEDDCREFSYVEAPISPTMEDILFGLAPPKPRSTPQSQAQHQQTFPSPPLTHGVGRRASMIEEDDAESGLKESVAAQHRALGSKCGAVQDAEAALYAGGSPCAMPARQSTLPPRSLDELRRMTSSEVREELERFFVRKDADAKHFKSIEAALFGGDSAAVAGAASGKECTSYTVRPTREELLARDRCRRLVNVSNWDAAVGGYSQWDVLLPSALLQDCVMAPTDASAGQAAVATAASSGRQSTSSAVSTLSAHCTLRPHQVEGIRFMWSLLAEGPAGQVPAVGCILAHTMGLGKTAQVVVFLHLFMAAFPRCQEGIVSSSAAALRQARVLIVIPKSTQSGWKREFRTWSACFPEKNRLRPISLDEGMPARQRIRIFSAWRRDGGVLLIGYEALVRLLQLVSEDTTLRPQWGVQSSTAGIDGGAGRNGATQPTAHAFHLANHTKTMSPQQRRSELQARRNDEGGMTCGGDADPFTELVVCDEAHRLKSVHLNVVTALRSLHPLRRLLLTGTPLQNHLREYWAMMDFCVHKYFSRKRFQEYFIQPIEASASTRASEKEVDLARKKTFTLIKEVRHFVQRVDSTPLRAELPPLHEYIVVVPPSSLQKEMYRRFIRLVQHNGSQKLQFLPAVSYSGKIAAHPQLLFQMRGQFEEAKDKTTASSTQGMGSSALDPQRSARDYHTAGTKRSNSGSSHFWDSSSMADGLRRPHHQRHRQEAERSTEGASHNTVGDAKDGTRAEEEQEALVIVDSDAGSTSSSSSDDDNDEEHVFARATQQSFSSVYPAASLTYEELCVPPSPNYTPLLEDGVKLLVAMRLVAAAIARDEKVLLFSLSTQLLTFLESMIAKVNIEWCRPVAASQRQKRAQLPRPIRYCRLDGSHRAAQRAAMLEAFDRPDGPDLFLLSIKAGGVGITVTAATRVILVDTSFNPADDQQAIGRAYRFGQTRPVYVYRLICYPTLEYSIFVQKLAKEWLFKTVIEESSVKRDGLSGMHLRELFSLLTRTAKVLEKPLSATHTQTLSTQEVLREDPMLSVVQAELLYAQRYEMFLEHNMDDRYGAAEEAFYHDYCRSRLFDTADDEDAEKQRATELQRRRQQRADEAAQLQVQSKTLTTMVDNLIRSRAGAESQLARLLTAMGLHVDPITGRVQLRRDSANMNLSGGSEARRHTAAPLLLEDGGEIFAPSPVQLIGRVDAYQGNQQLNGGAGTYASHSTPQTAVLLLDSDEESQDLPVQPNAHENDTNATLSATANAERISATLARQPYAPYRPGSSPAYAVDIDNDGLK